MTSAEYQQLVEFLGRQFTEIDHRFAEMDRRFTARFDDVDRRLGEMLGHFDEIYRRFERLEQEYQMGTQALRRIEAALADEGGRREILERGLAELKERVAALQSRIEGDEQRLGR
jgi:chromosome segregation ATPase